MPRWLNAAATRTACVLSWVLLFLCLWVVIHSVRTSLPSPW
jgi:hypothetical protein